MRNALSDPALAYLALTFAQLDRGTLANELMGILAARAKVEGTAPGRPARVYWSNSGRSRAIHGADETTALVALAFSKVRPQAIELDGAIAWLLAHRAGTGWRPHKAKGPALAALASYYGRAQGAEDRYRLTVTVNQTQVAELNVTGSAAGSGRRHSQQGTQECSAQPRPIRHGGTRPLWLRRHDCGVYPRFQARPGRHKPGRHDQSPCVFSGGARA